MLAGSGGKHDWLRHFYSVLWLGNLGVGVAFPFALSAGNIGEYLSKQL